jgi:hypothetical protein
MRERPIWFHHIRQIAARRPLANRWIMPLRYLEPLQLAGIVIDTARIEKNLTSERPRITPSLLLSKPESDTATTNVVSQILFLRKPIPCVVVLYINGDIYCYDANNASLLSQLSTSASNMMLSAHSDSALPCSVFLFSFGQEESEDEYVSFGILPIPDRAHLSFVVTRTTAESLSARLTCGGIQTQSSITMST